MPGKQHEIWFYEKFATGSFQVDRAEDWAGLQVMDGNTLKPAMGQGFQGRPSSEQIENLYKMAEAGKLVFFSLTNKQPVAVTLNGNTRIDLNAVKPEMPVEPGPDATSSEKTTYKDRVMRYGVSLEKYEKNRAMLDKMGAGFKEAVEAHNNTRNMEAEQTEQDIRAATSAHVEQLRRLENTDRLINETFGPRPVASAEFFYENVGDHGDFVFKHSEFDQQFAPNGYDLPTDSKLTAQDVAAINFAMMGASEFVEKFYKEQLHAGDSYAKNDAALGFQMLVTGCFGKQRKDQLLPGHGVLDATFKLGKEVVAQYNSGNSEPLGKNLADCVRNIKAVCTGHSWDKVSQDMVAGARVIGRIQELFDKHEDIKQAANLTEKEQQFMRGYVQLGKAYEQHLKSMIKFGDSVARGKELSVNEKAEILADAVLRRLVEKDFIADKEIADRDPEYRKQYDTAAAQDFADAQRKTEWWEEHPTASAADVTQYMMGNDMGIHSTLLSTRDLDHGTIFALAKNGMLEKMRNELMQNPAIREAAAKEPFEFSGQDLEKSEKLDALAAQAEATNNLWKTQVWYENLEATLVGSRSENWLNPNTPGDNNRLMIGWTSENATTGAKEVKLIGLDALLEGGVKALENPSQETLNILYEHAAKGNLYYYDVGKDMPIRVGAENARSTAEQLEAPPQPTLWQTIAYYLTFGLAYAEICNPTPDKDPAAFKAILAARESHRTVAKNEAETLVDPVDIGEPDIDVKHSIEKNVKDVGVLDASEKAKSMYGEGAALSESNVGTAADKLRTDINGSLDRLLNGGFDINEAKETFSKMVLLEVVKRGRSFDAITGDLMAGRVESTLAQRPEDMVLAMRENSYIKAASENLTLDTLRQFVLNDGAKALADKITAVAKEYNPDAKGNEPQMQNEQEIQKQQAMQKLPM